MTDKTNPRHTLRTRDSIRLLSNAIRKVHHYAREGEGLSLRCRDEGELMLQDALEYLAQGDTINARKYMALYDAWRMGAAALWPFDPDSEPLMPDEVEALDLYEPWRTS